MSSSSIKLSNIKLAPPLHPSVKFDEVRFIVAAPKESNDLTEEEVAAIGAALILSHAPSNSDRITLWRTAALIEGISVRL